jgi:hypothetical protein
MGTKPFTIIDKSSSSIVPMNRSVSPRGKVGEEKGSEELRE